MGVLSYGGRGMRRGPHWFSGKGNQRGEEGWEPTALVMNHNNINKVNWGDIMVMLHFTVNIMILVISLTFIQSSCGSLMIFFNFEYSQMK